MLASWEDQSVAAHRWLELGEPALFATLLHVVGPSYRPLGSVMIATAGVRLGGISGGCLEDYVVREGMHLTAAGEASVLTFDTTHDPENPSPKPLPGCGGELHVLVEKLCEKHGQLLSEVAAARAQNRLLRLQTVVESREGKLFVRRDLSSVAAPLRRPVQHYRATPQQHWSLDQVILPPTRLVILGADDDAIALARQAKLLGWHVTVADRRARLVTRDRFPMADALEAGPWLALSKNLPLTERTVVVVMTHSVPDDAEILPWLLTHRTAFTGLLGPPSRRLALEGELRARGEAACLDQMKFLCSPVGLDLGEKSPEGIAVAIVGQVLAELNGASARPLRGER